jgi:hypothetical protein
VNDIEPMSIQAIAIACARAAARMQRVERIVCGELALRKVFDLVSVASAFDRDYEGEARLMRDAEWAGHIGTLMGVELYYDPTMPAEEWRVEIAKQEPR